MRSRQELEPFLEQYDWDHAEQGGLAGLAYKLLTLSNRHKLHH
jgi:hypothetical protein